MTEWLTGGEKVTKGYDAYVFLMSDIIAKVFLKCELFSNVFDHT